MLNCSERGRSAPAWRAALALAWVGLLAAVLAGPSRAQQAQQPTPAAAWAMAVPAEQVEDDDAARLTVLEFDWFDARRNRAVPVRLYLPKPVQGAAAPGIAAAAGADADTGAGAGAGADPAAAGDVVAARAPVPLVVFSHGIGGSRRGYSHLGRHWASQGWASLHLQHVGSDRGLWAGNPLAVAGRLQAAAQESEATARVADLSFALDQLLAGPLAGRIDASRIVAAGHSYGANTTLLAVGARVERKGRPLNLRDARFKAAILISAPPFYGESSLAGILGGITVPSLHITATEDIIRVPGYFSPAADRVAVYEATGGADKTLAVFEGGSHSVFTDRGGTGGVLLNPQIKAATQALSIAFLGSVFDGDTRALGLWAQRFAGLLARTSIMLP